MLSFELIEVVTNGPDAGRSSLTKFIGANPFDQTGILQKSDGHEYFSWFLIGARGMLEIRDPRKPDGLIQITADGSGSVPFPSRPARLSEMGINKDDPVITEGIPLADWLELSRRLPVG